MPPKPKPAGKKPTAPAGNNNRPRKNFEQNFDLEDVEDLWARSAAKPFQPRVAEDATAKALLRAREALEKKQKETGTSANLRSNIEKVLKSTILPNPNFASNKKNKKKNGFARYTAIQGAMRSGDQGRAAALVLQEVTHQLLRKDEANARNVVRLPDGQLAYSNQAKRAHEIAGIILEALGIKPPALRNISPHSNEGRGDKQREALRRYFVDLAGWAESRYGGVMDRLLEAVQDVTAHRLSKNIAADAPRKKVAIVRMVNLMRAIKSLKRRMRPGHGKEMYEKAVAPQVVRLVRGSRPWQLQQAFAYIRDVRDTLGTLDQFYADVQKARRAFEDALRAGKVPLTPAELAQLGWKPGLNLNRMRDLKLDVNPKNQQKVLRGAADAARLAATVL